MRIKPILIHFHFHRRRTGVTSSIENVSPYLTQRFETYIFGYGIQGIKISIWKLLYLILSREHFVLHIHRNNEMLFALYLRLLGGNFKLVATRHAESNPSKFTVFLLSKADEVISLTPSMAERLPVDSTFIGHGVDTKNFICGEKKVLEEVNQKRIVSVVGRVREAKGHKVFLEAISPLLQSYKEWAAVIVGKIDDRAFFDELKSIVTANGVEKQVYFFPETHKILDYYRASEVVVVPSFSEGFSLVCLEAMACSCTVIATERVGIHSSVIQDGGSGYLFPVGNKIKLQRILNSIIEKKSFVSPMAVRQTILSKWSAEKEACNLTDLYLR